VSQITYNKIIAIKETREVLPLTSS